MTLNTKPQTKSGVDDPVTTKVQSQVTSLLNLFTVTYEALLVKLEVLPDNCLTSVNENNPVAAKRNRRFEANFSRQIFEGKQKVRHRVLHSFFIDSHFHMKMIMMILSRI